MHVSSDLKELRAPPLFPDKEYIVCVSFLELNHCPSYISPPCSPLFVSLTCPLHHLLHPNNPASLTTECSDHNQPLHQHIIHFFHLVEHPPSHHGLIPYPNEAETFQKIPKTTHCHAMPLSKPTDNSSLPCFRKLQPQKMDDQINSWKTTIDCSRADHTTHIDTLRYSGRCHMPPHVYLRGDS